MYTSPSWMHTTTSAYLYHRTHSIFIVHINRWSFLVYTLGATHQIMDMTSSMDNDHLGHTTSSSHHHTNKYHFFFFKLKGSMAISTIVRRKARIFLNKHGNRDESSSHFAMVLRRTYSICVVSFVSAKHFRRYCHTFSSQLSTVLCHTYGICVVICW
jgi:hypothetical protein